jgi:DtxR family Mn-dependent transcriptional regulator
VSQSISESIQMYLVEVHRLSAGGQPVPLAQLAAALRISPVSANQMCRKLQQEGLLKYVPYRGVSITPTGEALAARILRRHRLWEVFLVERLQMRWEEAHETACRLEHATPDEVIERLDSFLDHPRVNPRGAVIPRGDGAQPSPPSRPLAEMQAGQTGACVGCAADAASCGFMASVGLRPGASFRVLAASPERILLEVGGRSIAVSHSLATAVHVVADDATGGAHPRSRAQQEV